ncbi:unnamed protein product [Somion occarium]|uniref:Uncharacterized protein n=1 Tax=Somion occarium TaxID=3059160 RepID=A0ABP1CPG5_9APHY
MAACYPLCNRLRSGSAPERTLPISGIIPGAFQTSSAPNIDSLSAALTLLTLTDVSLTSSSRTSSKVVPRLLYSQVVASRSPSLEPVAREVNPVSVSPDDAVDRQHQTDADGVHGSSVSCPVTPTVKPEDDGQGPWISVSHKCGHSKSPRMNDRQAAPSSAQGERQASLTDSQYQTVQAAEVRLTPAEQDLVQCRMSVVHDDGRAHRHPRSPDVFEEHLKKLFAI